MAGGGVARATPPSPSGCVAARRYERAMRIGIGIGDIAGAPASVDGLVAPAKRAEADGFASGRLANIFGMDAILIATLVTLILALLSYMAFRMREHRHPRQVVSDPTRPEKTFFVRHRGGQAPAPRT